MLYLELHSDRTQPTLNRKYVPISKMRLTMHEYGIFPNSQFTFVQYDLSRAQACMFDT